MVVWRDRIVVTWCVVGWHHVFCSYVFVCTYNKQIHTCMWHVKYECMRCAVLLCMCVCMYVCSLALPPPPPVQRLPLFDNRFPDVKQSVYTFETSQFNFSSASSSPRSNESQRSIRRLNYVDVNIFYCEQSKCLDIGFERDRDRERESSYYFRETINPNNNSKNAVIVGAHLQRLQK